MIPKVVPSTKIVNEEGIMEQPFRDFTNAVVLLSPIMGSGSPEGTEKGNQWQTYIDETGSSGSIKYIKKYSDIGGDTTKGWILQ